MTLATEHDISQWQRYQLQRAGETAWSSCIDGFIVQAILWVTDPSGAFWPLLTYAAALRDYRTNSHRKAGS